MADNTPDFENMSPEEIMKWMETLAVRQGATEGLTTSADDDIPEIDPTTVQIDEPGYVPYDTKVGSSSKPAAPPEQPPARTAQPLTPPARTPQPPAPPSTPPARTAQPLTPPARTPQPPAPPSTPPARTAQPPAAQRPNTIDQNALEWLNDFTSEQENSLFNLDLSGSAVSEAAPIDDPMAWLNDLAAIAPETIEPPLAPAVELPSGDTMAWLEQLAREQGARADEMTTDVAVPDFSKLGADLNVPSIQDPTSFLESLASAEGYDEEGVTATRREPASAVEADEIEQINQAISSGTVSPEQMLKWQEAQMEKAMQIEDDDLIADYDPDAPPVPAELPAWLIDTLGMPPTEQAQPANRPSLESLFPETDAPLGIPNTAEIEALFPDVPDLADEDEAEKLAEIEAIIQTEHDPWAEAFDDEYAQGEVDITKLPDWYERNLKDPSRIAAVERMEQTGDALPVEDKLPAGQQQPTPEWMIEIVSAPQTPAFEPVTAAVADIPDWIKEAEAAVNTEEIPAWLLETIQQTSAPEPELMDMVIDEPAPPASISPAAPAPRPAAVVGDGSSLAEARRLAQANDLMGSLAHYERLIRAQINLDDVVDDLSSLSRQHRDNPLVFRLLGDGLMRQGKLQQALDTYRQALNQL
jgi:hypothetical protein